MRKKYLLVLATGLSIIAHAQSPDLSFWDTNGAVRSFAVKGDTLFVGGDYTHVGPFTGGLLPVDAMTGASASAFDVLDGDVAVVIGDGAGGWYVGGSARIDTANLCGIPVAFVRHVRPDRTLDPDVLVDAEQMTGVNALALWEDRLIIAGEFATLNGQAVTHLAFMDTATAALAAFPSAPNGPVEDLEIVGDRLYLAGSFTAIGSEARSSLGAIDLNDGSVHGWQPQVEGPAYALAVSSDTMHIAGEFLAEGGMELYFMLLADLLIGDTALHPVQPSGVVNVLLVSGDTLFLGGDFAWLADQPRRCIGAVDVSTLSLLPLSVDIGIGAGERVNAIAVTPDRVYFGGIFTSIGTEPRQHAGAIDRVSGDPVPWAPLMGSYVNALGAAGADVLIGGRFHIANGAERNGLCAFRISTGELLPWAPGLIEQGISNYYRIGAMDVADNTLYIGGGFEMAEGQPRLNAAAYDLSTGALTAWDPQVEGAYVKTLKAQGGSVYLGGTFWNVGGQVRSRIAQVNTTDGAVTAWNPLTTTTFYVNDIAFWADTVIVGGLFTDMGGAQRNGLAALHPVTGEALDRSYTEADDAIGTYALLVRGNDVLAGGSFDTIFGGLDNFGLLGYRLDMERTHINWNPLVTGRIQAIEEQGNTIFLGGIITSINGTNDDFHPVVAVDTTSGVFTPNWLPDLGDRCAEVLAIEATPTRVFLGAEANGLAGSLRRFFMAVAPPTDVSTPDIGVPLNGLRIQPNPAQDRVLVEHPGDPLSPWSIALHDMAGRAVRAPRLVNGQRAVIDREELPAGMYVLTVRSQRGTMQARLVWE